MKSLLVFAITAFLWLSPSAVAQDPEADVVAVVNRLIDALNRGDSAMARSAFHAKVRLFTVDARGLRIEESAEGFIQSLGRPRDATIAERLSNVKTVVDGGLASVWADYKLFIGPRLNHCGVDHFLLVKEDTAWKIIELADTRRRDGC